MTIQDQVIMALTIWRENRGGHPQPDAMQSCANVILNRTEAHGSTVWSVCTKKLQFSSLTAPGDPELVLWPPDSDPQWDMALQLAAQAAAGTLSDLTGGSTLYYAPGTVGAGKHQMINLPDGSSIPFPSTWNPSAVTYVCKIGGQVFFRGA